MKRIRSLVLPVVVLCLAAVWALSSSPPTRGDAVLGDLSPTPAAVASVRVDGDARSESAEGADAHTPFLIGSVSKVFTAVAVMQQVEAGTLALDRPLGSAAPAVLRDVTVRDLLHHSTGLSRQAGLRLADRSESGPSALRDLVFSLNDDDRSGPRGAYEYSDANYLVLGYLVQQAAHTPFGEYLESEVFSSLGMADSRATVEGAVSSGVGAGNRIIFGRAVGYERPYSETGVAYGYVISSAADLSTFGAWLLNPSSRTGVLSARSVEQLMAPGPVLADGRHYAMGLRAGPLDGDGPDVVEHTGATPGFFAHLLLLPRERAVIVVLGNAYSEAVAGDFTGVGWNLARTAVGRQSAAASRDWMLWSVPWLLLIVAATVVGLLARQVAGTIGLVVRDREQIWPVYGILGLVLSVAILIVVALLPGLLGVGWRELFIWAPDVAWTAVVLGAASASLAVALAIRVGAALASRPRSAA